MKFGVESGNNKRAEICDPSSADNICGSGRRGGRVVAMSGTMVPGDDGGPAPNAVTGDVKHPEHLPCAYCLKYDFPRELMRAMIGCKAGISSLYRIAYYTH